MRGSFPTSMLKSTYMDLTEYLRKSCNPKLDQKILKYHFINVDKDSWPDLCAENNGASEKYSLLFKVADNCIEEVVGVHAYRGSTKKYLSAENENLTFVPALYQKVLF